MVDPHEPRLIADADGKPVEREVKTVHRPIPAPPSWAPTATTCKRRFEQPRVIGDTLEGVTGIMPGCWRRRLRRVQADRPRADPTCGTSYYAGLTAKYWIESVAKIPVNVEIASEYRYRTACRTRTPWW